VVPARIDTLNDLGVFSACAATPVTMPFAKPYTLDSASGASVWSRLLASSVDIWLTSDKRAYLVQLDEPNVAPGIGSDLGTYNADDALVTADGLFALSSHARADPV
jgi:hypothetical protein